MYFSHMWSATEEQCKSRTDIIIVRKFHPEERKVMSLKGADNNSGCGHGNYVKLLDNTAYNYICFVIHLINVRGARVI